MSIVRLRFEGPWGSCLLLIGFASFSIWYFLDARSVSSEVENLLLIGPASALSLVLCVAILVREVPKLRMTAAPAAPRGDEAKSFRERYGVVAAIIALVVYVVLMPWLGFDVGTFLFIAASMLIQGERRWWAILSFAAIMAVLTVYSMESILSVPVPSLLF
ncbi:tripartite tricarboxylate transporter TctB family protein [Aurantimonas sp. A2-1-M11]|uniref:tripartite tricarboxylate transporter TctB family protein n=1 Tax=Aurantimonas sp. A2-1-M11 TaxID=3113712 RepID=UPI002F94B35D